MPLSEGATPLIWAVNYNNAPLVDLLLRYNADPTVNFMEGSVIASPLDIAEGNKKAIEEIREKAFREVQTALKRENYSKYKVESNKDFKHFWESLDTLAIINSLKLAIRKKEDEQGEHGDINATPFSFDALSGSSTPAR